MSSHLDDLQLVGHLHYFLSQSPGSIKLIQHTLYKCVVNDVQSMLGEMLSGLCSYLFPHGPAPLRSIALRQYEVKQPQVT